MSYDIEFYEDNAITPGENDYVFAEYNLSYNYSAFLSRWHCYPRDCHQHNYAERCKSLLRGMTSTENPLSTGMIEKSWAQLINQDNEWNTKYGVIQYLQWVVNTSSMFPNKKMRCIG